MKKLDKITIKNFKSIRKLELKLNSLNVFIGGNGVGKSNFISAFKLLNNIINKNLQTFVGKSGGADRILYFGRKTSDRLEFNLSFDDNKNGYECTLVPDVEGGFIFEYEAVWFHNKEKYEKPFPQPLNSGGRETGLFKRSASTPFQNMADYIINDLKSWTIYHFHDTSDSAKVKQTCKLDDNVKLRSDASNLPAFLYAMKKKNPDNFENIEDTIRQVAPFFNKFNLNPLLLSPNEIRLEWLEKGSDDYFNAASLSDGTLRFMCLATLLLQPILPGIIFLDEPELGLHPFAINILAGLLKKASKKTQVIVATQSVTLVNQFDPENIFIVDREDNQSVFKHLANEDIENWLENYGLGELWEKNVFGGRP